MTGPPDLESTPLGDGPGPGHPDTARPVPVASPAVEALRTRLAAVPDTEHPSLIADFWTRAREHGTPLVEPLPGDRAHRAATFLWRGDRDTRRVLLVANRIGDREHLVDSLLSPLPGTDIWHLSFRLRADHRGSYRIAPDSSTGELPADPAARQQRLRTLAGLATADPLNAETLPSRWLDVGGSVFALPDAPPQPWAGRRPAVPRGTVEHHRVTSTALACEREVRVYLPPGRGHRDLPVLVLCDGDMWFGRLAFQDTLDALIADGAVPPLAVLAPHAVDNRTRWRELGGRDSCTGFLADEVLPWATGRWPLTADPARTVVAGQSLGGVTALYAGLLRPDRFGNVLAHSASLWWRPGLPPGVPKSSPDGPPWLVSRFAAAERRPLRVRLDVGLHEGTMLTQNRALHDVLRSLRYDVTHTEFNGGHDYACWRGCLADGLVATVGGGATAPA
ncbi:enterochelin esterase [Streptomyces sp. NPDC047017]|uniref:enterochelin esterase n=1 Tax=Streptomyces sp. NPDC047017 TaxID=3155024 RepID=UPI0033FBBD22